VPESVDLIDNDALGYESPNDIILEEIVMHALEDEQQFPKALQLLTDPNIFIGDTGASVDMTPNKWCITDSKSCDVTVHVGNSQHTSASHSGRLSLLVCDKTGAEWVKVTFPDMHLVPEAPYNIISPTSRMESGWDLGGNRHDGIWIEKDGVRICFDIRIETRKGVICAACFKSIDYETAAAAADLNVRLSIQQAHIRLGHMSEASTRQAAKAVRCTLTPGSLPPCEMCAVGKGRQKNLPKDSGGPGRESVSIVARSKKGPLAKPLMSGG
jgi:hypothetical protein